MGTIGTSDAHRDFSRWKQARQKHSKDIFTSIDKENFTEHKFKKEPVESSAADDMLNNPVDKVQGDDPIQKNFEANTGGFKSWFGYRSNKEKETNPPDVFDCESTQLR